MEPIRVETLDDPRVRGFRDIPDPVRLRAAGQFVAEGRFAVRRVLRANRIHLHALLVTETAFDALRDVLAIRDDVVVYLASRTLIRQIGGYDFHQGCLGLAERPQPVAPAKLLNGVARGRPIVILEQVGNPDNVGGVFRNAAAFGASTVLLSPGCCDPLYRKAVRTSIGTTLEIPFAEIQDWPRGLSEVRDQGYDLVALTPNTEASCLSGYRVPDDRGVALILGNEGAGLTAEVLDAAATRLRIELAPLVDSLNVATTAALALYHVQRSRPVHATAEPPSAGSSRRGDR